MTRSSYVLLIVVLASLLASASFHGCCGGPPSSDCHCLGCNCSGCLGPSVPVPGCEACGGWHGRGCDGGGGCNGCGGCQGCDCHSHDEGEQRSSTPRHELRSCEGCRGCQQVAGEFGQAFEPPPPAEADRLLRTELASAGELASAMCGVAALGLTDLVVERQAGDRETLGLGRVHVRGRPIPAPGVRLPAGLSCSGQVSYFAHRQDPPSDGSPRGWWLDQLRLTAVSTPGVAWTPPPTSSGHDWFD